MGKLLVEGMTWRGVADGNNGDDGGESVVLSREKKREKMGKVLMWDPRGPFHQFFFLVFTGGDISPTCEKRNMLISRRGEILWGSIVNFFF